MSKLRLSFACGPYDRTQSLRDGSIQVEGVDLNYVNMQPAEIFWRQLQYQEFDASEMSLSNYTTLVNAGSSRRGRPNRSTAPGRRTARRSSSSKAPPTTAVRA